MYVIGFPVLDPVAVEIGPLAIRWYAIAYVLGLLIGWRYVRYLARSRFEGLSARAIDDLLIWCTLGVVLGGRLGYVLFYQPGYFFSHPGEILQIWQGGMSFHGGLVGTLIVIVAFARMRRLNLLTVADIVACAVPIGLFLGRMANFVNGELFGRPSAVPWAMVFPNGGPEPRHPSQLYEAIAEGALLFALLAAAVLKTRAARHPGLLTGLFLIGYGIGRIVCELFREPDVFLGFIAGGVTMGQLLSLPMVLLGLILVYWARPARSLDAKP
jgi:phosphatidylglycerol:prolipoprotein diacylglycerol transferase